MTGTDRNDTERRLEEGLARWLSEKASTAESAGLLDRVLAQTETAEQVRGWTARLPTRRRPFSNGRVTLAFTAALVVVLVAGASLVGLRSASQSAHTGAATWVWAQVTDGRTSPALLNGTVTDVVGYGLDGNLSPSRGWYIAVGGWLSDSGTPTAGVWEASDPGGWSRDRTNVPESDRSEYLDAAILDRVVLYDDAVVAIGSTCAAGQGSSCRGATAFRWSATSIAAMAATSFSSCCGSNSVRYKALAAGSSRVVAVGMLSDASGLLLGASTASSADGLTWAVEPTVGPLAGASMVGVAAGRPGFVAVGSTSGTAAVWTSPDGITWTSVPRAVSSSGSLADVAANTSVFVAVGRDGTRAASWTSADGRTWSEAPVAPQLAAASMERVVWTGATFVALGRTDAGDGAAWVSDDGSTWTRLDTGSLFAGGTIRAAAPYGSDLILFGTNRQGVTVVAVGGP